MTKKDDLEIGFWNPSCSSFEMTSEYFPWFKTAVVILCFDIYHQKSCFSLDGQLTHIGDSNQEHFLVRLTKYKSNLLAVSGDNQMTEILEIDGNKNFSWSVVEPDFKFYPGEYIYDHSLVTVESSDINEEYVLLIGGINDELDELGKVFKFNGTWFPFGKLNKPRGYHSSVYWNGAVYVIGGEYNYDVDNYKNTKMEIWNIQDSPDQFKTKENWPELFNWRYPQLFIVSDSFFPDH